MTKSPPKPKVRNAVYWRGRLEREHTDIYARLLAGDIPSVRAACAEARLIHLPTRADALKREWAKASPAERREFIEWARRTLVPKSAGSPLPVSLIGPDGFLLPEVADRIKAIMTKPGPFGPGKAPQGRIMTAMGYARSSTNLTNALHHRGKPKSEFLDRLRIWIIDAEG